MSRYPQGAGERGSLRWIQEFANNRSEALGEAIREASSHRVQAPIDWLSPLDGDDFAEYRDAVFLERLGITLDERPLEDFWPRLGPQWDALGRDASGAAILVEAKANVPEVVSDPTGAGPASKERIDAALREVADHLGADSSCDWSGTFYQYTNRLAHLYLLQELNDVDAWLVFVYFVGASEVDGPEAREEWEAGLEVLHGALGLTRSSLPDRVVDVFLDVSA